MSRSVDIWRLVRWIASFFVLTLVVNVGMMVGAIIDPEREGMYAQFFGLTGDVASTAWNFIRPFLQLILVLIIIDWILGKWGISWQSNITRIEWNVQTIIALIVIGAFALAALGGITAGVETLKDLALVVVGFYFGTQRKSVEMQTEKGKVTVVEEHENEVRIQTKEASKPREDEEKPPTSG